MLSLGPQYDLSKAASGTVASTVSDCAARSRPAILPKAFLQLGHTGNDLRTQVTWDLCRIRAVGIGGCTCLRVCRIDQVWNAGTKAIDVFSYQVLCVLLLH
jgi:hypothetical protein